MGYSYLACRSNGHEWRTLPPIGYDDRTDVSRPLGGMFYMSCGIPSTCQVCGTQRIRWITRHGESVLRYTHPDDYAVHGDDKPSSQDFRHDYAASIFARFEQQLHKEVPK